MEHEDQHHDLAEALRTSQPAVVVSGYPSTLYERLYRGWARTELHAFTGQGGRGRDHGQRTEVLWSNREFTQPHH